MNNMKNYIHILLVAIICMCITSCNKIEILPNNNLEEQKSNNHASLVVSLETPLKVFSRTLADDPYNEDTDTPWTEWEQFCDGALLYRVTLFVIDQNNTMVAYRDIYKDSKDIDDGNGFYDGTQVVSDASTGIQVKATFSYENYNEDHGPIERLKAGTYKLMAVANYSPITSGDHEYSGLGKEEEDSSDENTKIYTGNGDFTDIISSFIGSNFPSDTGIGSFTEENSNTDSNIYKFFHYEQNSGEDRVCKILPQPLVMYREDIVLEEGKTTEVDGLLSRTFARIRLEVKNTDTENGSIIDVSNLVFAEAYASQKAYLFNDVTSGDNLFEDFELYDDSKGNLGVTSKDAIIPGPSSSESTTVMGNQTVTLFDCYILEGKIESNTKYTFSFDASYSAKMQDGDATSNCRITSFYSNTQYPSSGQNVSYGLLDPSFYLFIRAGTDNETNLFSANQEKKCIDVIEEENAGDESGNNGGPGGNQSTTTAFTLDPEYIWEITLTGDPEMIKAGNNNTEAYAATGYLKSVSTGLYLQPYGGVENDNSLKLAKEPAEIYYRLNFQGEDERGTIFSKYGESWYYIEIDDKGKAYWKEVDSLTSLDDYTAVKNNQETRYEFDFQKITFETIVAVPVSNVNETVQQHFYYYPTTEGGTKTQLLEIVRNDFYRGIVQVSP